MIITPAKLKGEIVAPPSKSISHRAIIAAALADKTSQISNIILSSDINATIDAVKKLGAKVCKMQNSNAETTLEITGIKKAEIKTLPDIDCRESGSTLRFMIPITLAAAGGGQFTGSGRLPKRPLEAYQKIFLKKGIKWEQENDFLPLKIYGKMKSGQYILPGNISSQYITGMLMALPLLKGDSILRITGKLESSKYVDITIDVLSSFGIKIIRNEADYIIKGEQKYKSKCYNIEGDWSQAAFFMLAGILGDGIKIHGLNKNTKQGDIAVIDILKSMGAEITWENDVLCILKSELRASNVDVMQCPDLAPVIAAAMSIAEGKSTIYGGRRLKIKESDRIMSISSTLNKLGADVTPFDDGMKITGIKNLRGFVVDSFNDHRIAMMTAAVSSKSIDKITLNNAHCVNKSYPSFWDDFTLMGGIINE